MVLIISIQRRTSKTTGWIAGQNETAHGWIPN